MYVFPLLFYRAKAAAGVARTYSQQDAGGQEPPKRCLVIELRACVRVELPSAATVLLVT
jgi:hypothetical protein